MMVQFARDGSSIDSLHEAHAPRHIVSSPVAEPRERGPHKNKRWASKPAGIIPEDREVQEHQEDQEDQEDHEQPPSIVLDLPDSGLNADAPLM